MTRNIHEPSEDPKHRNDTLPHMAQVRRCNFALPSTQQMSRRSPLVRHASSLRLLTCSPYHSAAEDKSSSRGSCSSDATSTSCFPASAARVHNWNRTHADSKFSRKHGRAMSGSAACAICASHGKKHGGQTSEKPTDEPKSHEPERLVQHEHWSRGATDIDSLRCLSKISRHNRVSVEPHQNLHTPCSVCCKGYTASQSGVSADAAGPP